MEYLYHNKHEKDKLYLTFKHQSNLIEFAIEVMCQKKDKEMPDLDQRYISKDQVYLGDELMNIIGYYTLTVEHPKIVEDILMQDVDVPKFSPTSDIIPNFHLKVKYYPKKDMLEKKFKILLNKTKTGEAYEMKSFEITYLRLNRDHYRSHNRYKRKACNSFEIEMPIIPKLLSIIFTKTNLSPEKEIWVCFHELPMVIAKSDLTKRGVEQAIIQYLESLNIHSVQLKEVKILKEKYYGRPPT